MMRLLVFGVFAPIALLSQTPAKSVQKAKVLNIYPITYANTNGLSISIWGEALFNGIREQDLPTVNGVDFNLNPWSILAYIGGSPAVSPLNVNGEWTNEKINSSKFKKVNGVRVGLLQDDPTYVNGLQAHIVGNVWTVVKGVSIGGYCGRHYELHGLALSTLFNRDQKTRGLQISIFYNRSDDLRGFQFGLWNKNQKRSLPFINWSF